ncbi:MAG: arginine--tRNA ligase [Gammaproteobacteria bacterium]
MKHHLTQLLAQAVDALRRRGSISDAPQAIHIERARKPEHGDFATNLALTLAKPAHRAPRELAAELLAELPPSKWLQRAEIAGPGFINLFVPRAAYCALIDDIRRAGANYGSGDYGRGRSVLVEFVSANPTGPLHVGHGRGAAYGDAVARVLRAAGYRASTEYYVNDAGRQMDILALSVWLRYLQLDEAGQLDGDGDGGEPIEFPANAYQGDYVRDLAAGLRDAHGRAFAADARALFAALPASPESRIDALIAACKAALGGNYRAVFEHACAAMLEDIRGDLREFGVHFDNWFSERALLEGGDIEKSIAALRARGHIYEKDGAQWFAARAFGDEKDRAVRRANGSHTYFASDIAYHFNKISRGFDCMLDVFGADHHGYAKRIGASCEALGYARGRLQVQLVQFVTLYRDRVKVQMSTRGGCYVPLRELREEVGNDAARFFYVSRKNDQHIEFDLNLAKTQSADNPVYYVQYAHARICSVFRQSPDKNAAPPEYALLTEPKEFALMQSLSRYPEVVEHAAAAFAPHLIAYYVRELAADFHAYYNAHPFLSSAPPLRRARLGLLDATRQTLANGLGLLGVSAPERM